MFRFLPSIPVPYKIRLHHGCPFFFLSYHFYYSSALLFMFLSVYAYLFSLWFQLFVTVLLKPNKIMGRSRERSMKSMFRET